MSAPLSNLRGLDLTPQPIALRDGLAHFQAAVQRAASVTPLHQSLIVPCDGGYVRVCSCGWLSLPLPSYAHVEQSQCAVWIAEVERQGRAVRGGRSMLHALQLLADEARALAACEAKQSERSASCS